ncbi:MAG TPA: GldG family protein [Candidatus Didemnitutus sp.]|nr:GldG family protein [Candidatus Didemnitutus sp.]
MRFADSFRAARWVRLCNLLLQAVLLLTFFGGLNYIALNHSWGRFDLTRARRQSLSTETRSYLDSLEQPVRILVTLTDDSDNDELTQAYSDIMGLLREYAYDSSKNPHGKIEVEQFDIYKNRRKAEDNGVDQPNQVILICGDHRRVLTLPEFYRTKVSGKTISREAFQGESTITAAILDVSSSKKKKIYFLQGHGEASPDDVGPAGLSLLASALQQRNFQLAGLDLGQTHKIPDDATLIILAGQQGRVLPYEEELLRNYLQTRAGRVILMLAPKYPHGLENLLFDWGTIVYDDVIYDSNPQELDEAGNLRLRFFQAHPITQNLIDRSLPVIVASARVVSDEPGRASDDGLTVRKLIATSETAWGEAGYRLQEPPQYTPGIDLRGHLGVLVVSERVKPANNLPLSVPGGRLAVFGTADLVANNRIINYGNLNLFLSTVNWCVDQDTQVNIPARAIERFQLALSREELGRLRLGLLLIIPGAVAILGLVVTLTRRR